MSFSKTELLEMYGSMVLGRVYDNAIQKAAMDGDIIGMHHLGQGQEAIGAGIIGALKETDWFMPTHRMHSAHLKRADLKKFAAEQFGKVDGYNKGMACDFHLSNPELRLIYANGILGQNFPIATGVAMGLKLQKKDEIVMACEGDGACSEGISFEAMNMAAIFELPIVFIIEDNGYAISWSSERMKGNFADIGSGFGIAAVTVDGNDVLAVREAALQAVALARQNKPGMVVCKTMRWSGHHTGDFQPYRDRAIIEQAKQENDPINRFEEILLKDGTLTEELKANIWDETKSRVDEAIEFAKMSEYPDEDILLDPYKLYVNPWEEAI